MRLLNQTTDSLGGEGALGSGLEAYLVQVIRTGLESCTRLAHRDDYGSGCLVEIIHDRDRLHGLRSFELLLPSE